VAFAATGCSSLKPSGKTVHKTGATPAGLFGPLAGTGTGVFGKHPLRYIRNCRTPEKFLLLSERR